MTSDKTIALSARGEHSAYTIEAFEINGHLAIPFEEGCAYVSKEQAKQFFGLVDEDDLRSVRDLLKRSAPAFKAVDKLLDELAPLVLMRLNIKQAAEEIS